MFDKFFSKIKEAVGVEPSIDAICNKLVKKFLTPDEIKSLPISYYHGSSIKIIDNNEVYVVALQRQIFESDVEIRIYKLADKSDLNRNRWLEDIEKCRFMIKHINMVEESIKDISNDLKNEIKERQEEMRVEKKCIKSLESLIN